MAFTDTGCLRVVGDAAKTQVVLNPRNTIFSIKRLLGLVFSGPEVRSDIKLFRFLSESLSAAALETVHPRAVSRRGEGVVSTSFIDRYYR